MTIISTPVQNLKKFTPIRSVIVSIEDVKKIHGRLIQHVQEEGKLSVDKFNKPDNVSNEEFEDEKKRIEQQAFRVSITVVGDDGSSLYGDNVSIFDSPTMPDNIHCTI